MQKRKKEKQSQWKRRPINKTGSLKKSKFTRKKIKTPIRRKKTKIRKTVGSLIDEIIDSIEK